MGKAHLFRLGMDLGTGTTHAEDHGGAQRARLTVVEGEGARRGAVGRAREDHFVCRDGEVFAGTHLIIELVGGEGLDDAARIERAFRDCVEASGATLLHVHTHRFSPQGVSGVAVLAESHISVHTWPEIGYGAFDVFMCGEADPWAAVEVLRSAFGARELRVTELKRGEGLVEAVGD